MQEVISFNALAGGGPSLRHAFATTDPNVGVVKVPDHRLDALAKMSKTKSLTPQPNLSISVAS